VEALVNVRRSSAKASGTSLSVRLLSTATAMSC
jgi:hypothetical protein